MCIYPNTLPFFFPNLYVFLGSVPIVIKCQLVNNKQAAIYECLLSCDELIKAFSLKFRCHHLDCRQSWALQHPIIGTTTPINFQFKRKVPGLEIYDNCEICRQNTRLEERSVLSSPIFFFFFCGLQVGKVFCGIWLNGPKGGGFRMGGRGVSKSHRCRCCCIDFSLPCCWFCRCCFRVNVIDHKANNKGALQGAAGGGSGHSPQSTTTKSNHRKRCFGAGMEMQWGGSGRSGKKWTWKGVCACKDIQLCELRASRKTKYDGLCSIQYPTFTIQLYHYPCARWPAVRAGVVSLPGKLQGAMRLTFQYATVAARLSSCCTGRKKRCNYL